MARSYIYYSPCYNSSSSGKDKLVRGLSRASNKGNNTLTLFPAISWVQSLILALAPALTISSIKKLCL